jgi:hypothetical protein
MMFTPKSVPRSMVLHSLLPSAYDMGLCQKSVQKSMPNSKAGLDLRKVLGSFPIRKQVGAALA